MSDRIATDTNSFVQTSSEALPATEPSNLSNPEPATTAPVEDFTSENLDVGDSPWLAEAIASNAVVENVFVPSEPKTLDDAALTVGEVEALILKFLQSRGTASGRQVADQILLPLPLVRESLDELKNSLLVTYKAEAGMGDFVYQLTDTGLERAHRQAEHCTYFGAAPVDFDDYVASVQKQSLTNFQPRLVDMCKAFSDLVLDAEVISQLAQAITAGRGLFLYGAPGNGKTSIAERITRAFGSAIWIPRTLNVNGEMIRLYDPSNHEILPLDNKLIRRYDRRWIYIRRPTIVVGGELTLQQLDIRFNPVTGISEAPVHLKSNCGTLVIDDFGRQRVSSRDLLNRWIVPLEKHRDYLNMLSGRQIEVPFEQLLVLSTNLEPRELVDEAFLRRIPYKIKVTDPTEEQFRQLCRELADQYGLCYDESAVDHVLQHHFRAVGRHMRFCHPRDLLLQIRNLCRSHECAMELSSPNFDIAAKNYFAML